MMTLMMCLMVIMSLGQVIQTTKCSVDPMSKQYTITWEFSDSLITYQYTHPKMIKLIGNEIHRLKVEKNGDNFYYGQYGDVKCRVTLVKNIINFETFDTFSNKWTQITYY